MRTRIKFCGFTREQDLQTAVAFGVDALGFVFYPPSPRYIAPESAAALIQTVPAFIQTVGLFVNETIESIAQTLLVAPMSAIQLHGDETWDFAMAAHAALQRPVIKAVRVNQATDWDEVAHYAHAVAGVLLDADVVGYGGAGHVFDWAVIPTELRSKIILSGGLKVENLNEAIQQVKPYALDVSSGIEAGMKGVKDTEKMQSFVQAVQRADRARTCKADGLL